MKNEDLVMRWRNGGEENNPAGPLFVAGEFAEVDITNDCAGCPAWNTCGTGCSGSGICWCC
jgi:hypothetical protein